MVDFDSTLRRLAEDPAWDTLSSPLIRVDPNARTLVEAVLPPPGAPSDDLSMVLLSSLSDTENVPFYTLEAAREALGAENFNMTAIVVGKLADGTEVAAICRGDGRTATAGGFSVRGRAGRSIPIWGDAFLLFKPKFTRPQPNVKIFGALEQNPLELFERLSAAGEIAVTWHAAGPVPPETSAFTLRPSSSGIPVFHTKDLYACTICSKPCHKTCGLCKSARYCSEICSKADWKAHKKICKGRAAAGVDGM